MIDLTGRVVLITGAAGGIGSATARTLARGRARLVIQDVKADGCRRSLTSSATGRTR